MEMPGRKWVHSDYRFGNQGAENDDEIFDGAQNLGLREYDERIGRMFSKDPFAKYLPNKSPYTYAGNSPIAFIDENGGFQVVPGVSCSKAQLEVMRYIARAVSNLASEKGADGVVGNNPFVSQFMSASGLPNNDEGRARALQILSYGSGPIIAASNNFGLLGNIRGTLNDGAYFYDNLGQAASNFVFINQELIDYADNGRSGFAQGSISAKIIAIITLWHEGIHYADWAIDGVRTPNQVPGNDIGNTAEFNLFGGGFDMNAIQGFWSGSRTYMVNGVATVPAQPNDPKYALNNRTAIQNFLDMSHGGNLDKTQYTNSKGFSMETKQAVLMFKAIGKAIGSVIRSFRSSGGDNPLNKGGNPRY